MTDPTIKGPPKSPKPKPERGPVARVLMGVMIFQLGIGALLLLGDVQGSWKWPGASPKAPHLTERVRPGDQRRRFKPANAPPNGQPFPSSALPDRLVLTVIDQGVLIEGAIEEGDANRISKQLETLEPRPDTVILNSPGGSVGDALSLGRRLRDEGLNTHMRDGDICYSACPYLLAAGVQRTVDENASVGVHQHYFGESTILPAYTAVEDIQRGQAEVMRYLDQMGVEILVMQHAMSTPPDEIYVLLPEELTRYKLTLDE